MAERRNDRNESPENSKQKAPSGLRVPLPAMLAGFGVLAAGAPGAQAAQANPDFYTVRQNGILTGVNVLSNDSYTPPFTIQHNNGSHGNVQIDLAGNLQYVPFQGYAGPDQFQYRLNDSSNVSSAVGVADVSSIAGAISNSSATFVSIMVGAPEAVNDSYWLTAGFTLSGPNIVANDYHVGNSLSVMAGAAGHGTATVDALGNLSYTPDPGFVGTDSFNYVITDNFGNSAATVDLFVSAPAAQTPTLGSAALAGLSGLLAFFGMRRRRQK